MTTEIEVLLTAIQEAGAAILDVQKTNLQVSNKANNDIVTAGDLVANKILQHHLMTAFPNHGWLSEESVDDFNRLQQKRIFIVDPIDGTREFAIGIPEYAISVALVENHEPIAAAIMNPVTGELFHAVKGRGAWLNGQRIFCKNNAQPRFTLLASRSEFKRGEWDIFKQEHEVTQVGSIAYKLALIAAGKADATFSLGPKSEWDIAAGVLIVQEAGGFALDQTKVAFKFNSRNVLVNGIVAASNSLKEPIFKLINTSLS